MGARVVGEKARPGDLEVDAAGAPDSESEEVRARRADWDGAWKQLVTCFPGQVLAQVCGLEVEGAQIVGLPAGDFRSGLERIRAAAGVEDLRS